MSHIHVCLVSEQPIPNLTTALQLNPETVLLLTTKEMIEQAVRLNNVLVKQGIEVEQIVISAYDINNVISQSENVLEKFRSHDVSLNITGGTKVGTLGVFQVFYTSGKPIYYVNTKDNKILKLFPEKEQEEYPINVKISIKDYLAVYGFMVDSYIKNDGYLYKRKELTNYLAYSSHIIGELNHRLHDFSEKTSFPIVVNIPADDKLKKLTGLLESVTEKSGHKIEISGYDDLRYLKGIWFEEYIYMLAKNLGADEVWLNVIGKWVTKGQHHPRNEFDVLIAKGTRLFYISCKTANPNRKTDEFNEGIGREYLYELDCICDNALGLFGKRMLASVRKIEDPYVRERAKILKIDTAEGKDINTLKDKLKQWLK